MRHYTPLACFVSMHIDTVTLSSGTNNMQYCLSACAVVMWQPCYYVMTLPEWHLDLYKNIK